MLGRGSRASPQFINSSDGSWLGMSATIERITAMSSMCSATCGNSSLTSMPLWPYFLKFERRGKRGAGFALGLQIAGGQLVAGVFVERPAWDRTYRPATARRS